MYKLELYCYYFINYDFSNTANGIFVRRSLSGVILSLNRPVFAVVRLVPVSYRSCVVLQIPYTSHECDGVIINKISVLSSIQTSTCTYMYTITTCRCIKFQ